MFAVILAAGRGTRMGPLTEDVPKPLLPLCGRPIIEHILSGLAGAGVTDAVVVTGYRGAQIEARLGDGRHLGLRLSYRRQRRATGTAQALLLACDLVGGAPFLVSWGDVVVAPASYGNLCAAFARRPGDPLLSVNATTDPWRGAAVYVDREWRVTGLIEKPPPGTSRTPWNNAGIFVCTPPVLRYAERLQPSPRGEYELPQALAAMVRDGCVVRAFPLAGFWSDLGTPADLAAAERHLAAGA